MVQDIWRTALQLIDTTPPWLAAIVIGWVISIGITQSVKFVVPVRDELGERWDVQREAVTRLIAFLSGFTPAVAYGLTEGLGMVVSILCGVIAGVWSPVAFALLQRVLRRWWPWAADVLSSDVRGVIIKSKE